MVAPLGIDKKAVQPSLTAHWIMATIDVLVENVCIVTTKASHFLFQTPPRLNQQIVVTAIP